MPPRSAVLFLVIGLTACSLRPAPTPPAAEPTPRPSPTQSSSASVSAPSRAPSPSVELTASPTPGSGALEVLDLEVIGCPGGVALDWSPAVHPDFHHYTALRSLDPDVATAYPPIAPAVDWGDSYATDRFVTTAVDATLIPSQAIFSYRVMAYDPANRPVAASTIRQSRPTELVDLGALEAEPRPGATRLDWDAFEGPKGCFSSYRVLVGPSGSVPSATLTVVSDRSRTAVETPALDGGTEYAVRVEVVRSTTLGNFVVARSEIATVAVP